MKKIFSLTLVFVLALVFSTMVDVKAADNSGTLHIHIHQFDGDYTNTGTGMWDGTDWNNWADSVTSTDAFGGVITKTWAVLPATINDNNEIEIKPASNCVEGDNDGCNGSLIGGNPDEGKFFVDITPLVEDTVEEMHVYIVEGATAPIYTDAELDQMTIVVYANTGVVADANIYDGYGFWYWNNGEGVDFTRLNGWGNPDALDVPMNISAGDYTIPGYAAIYPWGVSVDAGVSGGFIAVAADDASKGCQGDMFLEKPTETNVVYYEHGNCEFTATGSQFLSDIALGWESGLVNKFVEGTGFTSPTTMDVIMFQDRLPMNIVDRIWVEADGVKVMPESIDYGIGAFGPYETEVEPGAETYLQVWVKTDLDHSKIKFVGAFQGWSPENGISSTGSFGDYAVFEVSVPDLVTEGLFLFDDVNETFSWDNSTKISGDANLVFELNGNADHKVIFDDATDTLSFDFLTTDASYMTVANPTVCAEGENKLTVFYELEDEGYNINNMRLVGNVQTAGEWDPSQGDAPVEVTNGIAVWEVCRPNTQETGNYKLIHDLSGDGFGWDGEEITPVDIAVDFTAGDVYQRIDGMKSYEPTITVVNTYLASIYVDIQSDVTAAQVAIVGELNGWDIDNPIVATKSDVFGNPIFDLELGAKGEYLVLVDAANDGFGWDDKVSGDANLVFNFVGAAGTYVMTIADEFAIAELDIYNSFTKELTLTFAEGAIVKGSEYKVVYLDEEEVKADVAFANGTFDVVDGWSLWCRDWDPVHTCTLEVADGIAVYTYDLTGDASWNNQLSFEGLTWTKDQMYLVTFDAKGDADRDFQVNVWDAVNYIGHDSGAMALTTEWQTFEYVFTYAGNQEVAKLEFQLGALTANSAGSVFNLDNVTIQAVTPELLIEMQTLTDTEGPVHSETVIDATVEQPYEINMSATFDLMDYLSLISFVDNTDGEVAYEVSQALDLTTAGAQNYIITATDSWGNVTEVTYQFVVVDDIAPTLTQDNPTLEINAEEPDWTSFVTADEEVTYTVDTSQVNMAAAGLFYVEVEAEDAGGNTSKVNLEVMILDCGDDVFEDGVCVEAPAAAFPTLTVAIIAAVVALGAGALVFFKK